MTYFGDGAVNIGSVLETMNLAAAWKIPLCFFIENNRYAVSTRVEEATAEPRLSARGLGFNIASWQVDGMDPVAVHAAMTEAVQHMRAGHGPTIVEAEVYRFFHQNGPFPGSAFGYRDKEEEKAWRLRDPLSITSTHLERLDLLAPGEADRALSQAKDVMEEIGNILLEPVPGGKPGQRQIRAEEWPDPTWVDVGVCGDLSEMAGAQVVAEFKDAQATLSGYLELGMDDPEVEIVPLLFYRLTPMGPITSDAFETMVARLLEELDARHPRHALVGEDHRDLLTPQRDLLEGVERRGAGLGTHDAVVLAVLTS